MKSLVCRKYRKQIGKLLEMAGEKFSNHGCNDLPDDFWEGVSKEDQIALYKEYHIWNGDPEEFNPEQIGYLGDDALMSFFAESIVNNEIAIRNDLLAEALSRVLKKAGVLRLDADPSGPELILASEEYYGS